MVVGLWTCPSLGSNCSCDRLLFGSEMVVSQWPLPAAQDISVLAFGFQIVAKFKENCE